MKHHCAEYCVGIAHGERRSRFVESAARRKVLQVGVRSDGFISREGEHHCIAVADIVRAAVGHAWRTLIDGDAAHAVRAGSAFDDGQGGHTLASRDSEGLLAVVVRAVVASHGVVAVAATSSGAHVDSDRVERGVARLRASEDTVGHNERVAVGPALQTARIVATGGRCRHSRSW